MAKKDKKLGVILQYSYLLSMLVSPNAASSMGLLNFDGATCDFLKDYATAYNNGDKLNIDDDDFYRPVYEKMEESINAIYHN